jgi:hypothetical protein
MVPLSMVPLRLFVGEPVPLRRFLFDGLFLLFLSGSHFLCSHFLCRLFLCQLFLLKMVLFKAVLFCQQSTRNSIVWGFSGEFPEKQAMAISATGAFSVSQTVGKPK